MDAIFLKILNMSVTAGWLVLAVIVLRIILKKAPKAMIVALWALVGLRLILPVSLESKLSLLPSKEFIPEETVYSNSSAEPDGAEILDYINDNPVYYDLTVKDGSLTFTEFAAPDGDYVNPLRIFTYVGMLLWIAGMLAMLLYAAVSCLRIHLRVREAIPADKGVWICDRIDTPFIFGIIRPRIYLPSEMAERDAEYVIAHEKAHLRRKDHWWKPLGFLLLTVYWFHPLLWVAYILLCKDIELACDEKVIREMGEESKKPYSEALLHCSIPRKTISACPLAFGETGVKGRIKSVLHYKKPAVWVILAAIIVSIAVAVTFLTDPTRDLTKEISATTTKADVEIDVLSVTLGDETSTVLIRLNNNHEDELTYTDKFKLLRWQDEEWQNWQLNGIYDFSGTPHTLEPGDDAVLSFTWATADTSMVGKYRIEFDFELYDDWDEETETLTGRFHQGLLDFEIEEDLGIPNYTNFLIYQNTNGGLWLNRVNFRFALTNNGKMLEEGTYSTEDIPGMVVLRTDSGKQYYLVQNFNDHISLLQTHSDPIPAQMKHKYDLSVSFRDPKNGRLFYPSDWAAANYRVDDPDGWGAELWLTNMVHSGSGNFYIWDKPLKDGGIETVIQGEYRTDWENNLVICTASDGNIYRFSLSEVKNPEVQTGEADGFPIRFPIFLDSTAPCPFPVGEELGMSSK